MNAPIAYFRKKLALQDALFSLIAHEDAMVARVYRVDLPTGTPLILKICLKTDHFLREIYFLNRFANQLPVPHVHQILSPDAHHQGAILMQCLPGNIVTNSEITEALGFEMGASLARIHLNRTAGFGNLLYPETLSADPRGPFALKWEESIGECRTHLPQDLLNQCLCYFDRHCNLLSSVDGPCIVHIDFRPGNILAAEGKLTGIIDWSSAHSGFAEEDFCTLEQREWFSAKNAFFSGYASIRPVPDYSTLMPLLRLTRTIAAIGFTVKQGTWDTTHARFYKRNRQFLDAFLLASTQQDTYLQGQRPES